MLELIFLSPLILVMGGFFLMRFVVRKRPLPTSWFAGVGCLIAGAVALPLFMGVWVPDFLGFENTVGKAATSTGHEIAVVQRWNFADFYTTSVVVRSPDGKECTTVVDGDDAKTWRVPIALDESARMATVTLSGGRDRSIAW